MLRRLASDDIFISYSRGDAAIYADGLADALARKGFSVFIDRLGTEPSAEIPVSLLRKLLGASMLVVVGSPCAIASEFVGREVTEFAEGGRSERIVPIGFGNAVGDASWFSMVEGIPIEQEVEAALETGDVAPRVVSRIEKAFRYTRSKDRLRRYTLGALALLALLSIAGASAGFYARDQLQVAAAATQRATDSREAARIADLRASQAQTGAARAVAEAASAVAQADAQKLGAEGARDAALAQAEVAQRAAEDQQLTASALRLANESRANRGTSFDDLVGGLKLAVQSVQTRATRTGVEALREGLALVSRPEAVRGLAFTEGSVWISASGRAIALRRTGDLLHVWNDANSDTNLQAPSSTLRLPLGHGKVAISDDARLVASSNGTVIRLHATVSSTACEVSFHEDEYVSDIAVSGDGRHLVALVAQEEIHSLYVWRVGRVQPGTCRWTSGVRRLGDVQFDRPQRVRIGQREGDAVVNLHGHHDHGGAYYAYMRSFEIAAVEKGAKDAEALRLVESTIRRNHLGIGVAETPSGNLIAVANETAGSVWILSRNLLGGYDEAVRIPLRGKLVGAAFQGRGLSLYVKDSTAAVERRDWSVEGLATPIRLSFDEPLVDLVGRADGRLMTVQRSFDDRLRRRLWMAASGSEIPPSVADSPVERTTSAIKPRSASAGRALSMDGELEALGGEDGIVHIRQVTSGEALAVLRHDDPVRAIAFVQARRFLAVATAPASPDSRSGEESAVHLWRLDPHDLVREACKAVPAACAKAPALR